MSEAPKKKSNKKIDFFPFIFYIFLVPFTSAVRPGAVRYRPSSGMLRGGAGASATRPPMRALLCRSLLIASFAVRSSSTTSLPSTVPPRPSVPPPGLRYRAVALDIDGTLATSRRVERTWLSKGAPAHVSDATVEALKSYVRLGGGVCLATGRGRAFTTALARTLHERGLEISDLVCSDGALVLARSGPGGTPPPRHPRPPPAMGPRDNTRTFAPNSEWGTIQHNSMPSGAEIASVITALYDRMPGVAFGVETEEMGVIVSDQHYIDTINVSIGAGGESVWTQDGHHSAPSRTVPHRSRTVPIPSRTTPHRPAPSRTAPTPSCPAPHPMPSRTPPAPWHTHRLMPRLGLYSV